MEEEDDSTNNQHGDDKLSTAAVRSDIDVRVGWSAVSSGEGGVDT